MDREKFMDFYSDFSDEDPEYIHEYLVAEGIDIDGLRNRLLEMIEKRKAELRLIEGRKFKTAYDTLKQKALEAGRDFTGSEGFSGAAIAYRKLNGAIEQEPAESEDDAEKLRLIRQAKASQNDSRLSGTPDEPSDEETQGK